MAPNQESEQRQSNRGVCDETVAEDSFVAMNTHQFADDSHRWQNHDVHSWVRIEPEEVLVGDGVTIVRRIEDTQSEYSFSGQQQNSDTKKLVSPKPE